MEDSGVKIENSEGPYGLIGNKEAGDELNKANRALKRYFQDPRCSIEDQDLKGIVSRRTNIVSRNFHGEKKIRGSWDSVKKVMLLLPDVINRVSPGRWRSTFNHEIGHILFTKLTSRSYRDDMKASVQKNIEYSASEEAFATLVSIVVERNGDQDAINRRLADGFIRPFFDNNIDINRTKIVFFEQAINEENAAFLNYLFQRYKNDPEYASGLDVMIGFIRHFNQYIYRVDDWKQHFEENFARFNKEWIVRDFFKIDLETLSEEAKQWYSKIYSGIIPLGLKQIQANSAGSKTPSERPLAEVGRK